LGIEVGRLNIGILENAVGKDTEGSLELEKHMGADLMSLTLRPKVIQAPGVRALMQHPQSQEDKLFGSRKSG